MNRMMNQPAHQQQQEQQQHDYRAVIFWYNLAISMMEHGCYEQAYATLKNATKVFKTLLNSNGSSSSTTSTKDSTSRNSSINDKLLATIKSMSPPVFSSQRRSGLALHHVNVMEHTHSGLFCSSAMIRIPDTEHDDLLLLLNNNTDSEDAAEQAPTLFMAIVFNNLAVCSCYLSDTSTTQPQHSVPEPCQNGEIPTGVPFRRHVVPCTRGIVPEAYLSRRGTGLQGFHHLCELFVGE
jgi:hypothetical protein